MKKLIKLSETHYIIVDDSEIKEGDWYYNNKVLFLSDQVFDDGNNPNQNKANKKITHSTQSLESKFSSIIYRGYDHISLSEVEEVINGYSVQNLSYEKYNDGSVSTNTRNDWRECWKEGFNAHKELVKDKLFTEQDLREAISLAWNYGQKLENNLKDCGNSIIQSLLPKCEWGVEFDEQGKLKLL